MLLVFASMCLYSQTVILPFDQTGHWSSLLAFVVALDTHRCFFDWLFPMCCNAFMKCTGSVCWVAKPIITQKTTWPYDICFLMSVKTTLNLCNLAGHDFFPPGGTTCDEQKLHSISAVHRVPRKGATMKLGLVKRGNSGSKISGFLQWFLDSSETCLLWYLLSNCGSGTGTLKSQIRSSRRGNWGYNALPMLTKQPVNQQTCRSVCCG